jgi:hypothetical protein
MTDEPCSWRNWSTTVESTPDVATDVRDRLSAFLDPVLAHLDTLAARCAGADNVALIGALCSYVQHLDPTDLANELVADVYEQAMAVANDADVRAWTAIIAERLKAAALPIRWAVAGLLLERVVRASRVGRVAAFDPDALVMAADDLERAVQHLLRGVLTRAIPATSYRAM